jgi:glycosyltransferase involved in cell wall biosynthesis
MNVALVYDRINKFGGAEQILLALHELYPNAPLFTAVYDHSGASWAKNFTVIPSFLNRIPLASTHHELFPWVTPLAFESFNFDGYDVVISVTSAEAKSIITKPDTLHICYCLTPTRYLWSGYETYIDSPGLGTFSVPSKFMLKKLTPTLRQWDVYGSKRPDVYVAISEIVKRRIELYYKQEVKKIIFPPVDTERYSIGSPFVPGDYFLSIGRLVGYKRMDLLIDTFNTLGLPLIIIGDGRERNRLLARAKKNIRFIFRKLTETELAAYYQQCTAFVFAGSEDFGIVAAEAQACGKPVLCYKESGMAEIIRPGITGELIEEQSITGITDSILRLQKKLYSTTECRQQALKFSKRQFLHTFQTFVDTTYDEWIKRR